MNQQFIEAMLRGYTKPWLLLIFRDYSLALENLEPSELIPMDKTYRDRIELRRDLIKSHNRNVVGVNNEDDPRIRPAVSELYTYIMGTYLPGRYPTMFKLHTAKYDAGPSSVLENRVTGQILPTKVSPHKSTAGALETLGTIVDEDLLVLLPEETETENETTQDDSKDDSTSNDDGTVTKYILEAFVACFPSGFDPREKLGKRLNRIHDPVPGYPEKLEKSMDRFFNKVEVGKFVKRLNWSITTNGGELFAAFGTLHGRGGQELKPMEVGELDVEKVFLNLSFCVLRAKGTDIRARPISAVSVRRYTAYRSRRHWFSEYIPTFILSRRLRTKGQERSWRKLLMV